MKKIYAALIFFAFLIQFSFLPMFHWEVQSLNLILIIITVIGIRKSLMESIGWFLLAGLIFEIFSVEFFGFNLILFSLVGLAIWLFRNIVISKEYNIIVELVFWFLVKIIWDLFHKIESLLVNSLQQGNNFEAITLPTGLLKETIIFVVSGFLITILCKKLFKIST
jgi:hypothetical protein